ncbi:MAG: NUDIX hydrolase [Parcubacteria group bacterium GW2011_GWF2_38_76]|nr:MAG: NUDIX hydrolase [Parcubacteria group bacterium GW2011_GWF2_38_76]HBM45565.1 hypothetical protein [Patescibacteria group bacterium]
MLEIVDVVDEMDRVVGQIYRDDLREDGPIRRAVHVWFVTRSGEIIFQVRGAKKDTNPNMLDATVSGHIPSGESYSRAAVREVFEETGVLVNPENLYFLGKISPTRKGNTIFDPVFRGMFMYVFDKDISSLRIEVGEGAGFEKMHIDDVLFLRKEDDMAKMIVPGILNKESIAILKKIRSLICRTPSSI